jgi:cyanophycinase-like exopeptidase
VTRLLVLMGSGETAPTMVKPHRAIFARAGDAPALLLDTPYGFQSNADDISARAVTYFATSVGRQIDVLSWRQAPADTLARERAAAAVRDAGWLFAGPGSPTYALRHWRNTAMPALLADKLSRAGVVVFASAAALTLGSHAVPVYEIYKAGLDPHWVPGLDLLGPVLGFPAVVIPHYDNAEGGHHDARFCYLGERRLDLMEASLPEGTRILGVDEHTAVVIDLDAGSAAVLGNGGLTLRLAGQCTRFESGTELDLADLAVEPVEPVPAGAAVGQRRSPGGSGEAGPGEAGPGEGAPPPRAGYAPPAPRAAPISLRGAADLLEARFVDALAGRDVDGCVAALLEMEQTIVDWAADTEEFDGEYARSVLRAMVVRLGELARAGARDPRHLLDPFVSALLDVRQQARTARDFATSDRIRDRLASAGVEVRDTPDGPAWELS